MGVPPLWARLVGYGLAFAFLGWLGLKWGLIIGGILAATYIIGYRVRRGHWP